MPPIIPVLFCLFVSRRSAAAESSRVLVDVLAAICHQIAIEGSHHQRAYDEMRARVADDGASQRVKALYIPACARLSVLPQPPRIR